MCCFFFKQKTAYEMRISDWSSDVCSSDLMSGEGLVYIASHAVADPQNPLTRGFVAMAGEHYYAGYIRQEKFPDWKRQPPLVVVSACQTALGRVLDGGGFGVTQSWVEAGAGQEIGRAHVGTPVTNAHP